MRTTLRIAALAATLVSLSATADAQGILGRMAKKAQDAAEKKVEDKVNSKLDQMAQRMVDNTFGAMFGDSTAAPGAPSGSGSGSSAGGGLPFSIGSNAKTEDRYVFTVVSTMEIESTPKSGKAGKAVMQMHFNPNQAYSGTNIVSADGKKTDGTAFVVMDAKNQAMVMLMSNDKNKFSIAYDWKEAQKYAESASARSDKTNWDTVKVWRSYQKIGTRTIAGFAAEGYKATTTDGTTELWVSRDAKLGGGGMFGAAGSMKQMKGRIPAEMPYGMLLEMTGINSTTGDKVVMRVTDINANANVSYAMSDYPKMEMGKKQ